MTTYPSRIREGLQDELIDTGESPMHSNLPDGGQAQPVIPLFAEGYVAGNYFLLSLLSIYRNNIFLNMYKTISLILLAIFICAFAPNEHKVTIWLAGDSTMADKPLSDNPERGWGQMLPAFFDDEVIIKNYARNGRSTRNFLYEGRWDSILHQIEPGDYVFIQFGHNDAKVSDTSRYAPAQTDYRKNLTKMVKSVKEKNAVPVLVTPVYRRIFNDNNKPVDDHADYPVVMREVAAAENVQLIDLHRKSEKLLSETGPDKSKELYLGFRRAANSSLSEIKEDKTHFTQKGALKVASIIAEGIKELNLPVASHLKHEVLPGEKNVVLDYFFNNEWRKSEADTAVMEQYHYVWEDTTFSGFSELGTIITRMNGVLKSLKYAPTPELLKEADIYIIVDPDTKKESKNPHYIDESSRHAIIEWVKKGGVLLLFANDSSNCEFDSLNLLSKEFGITFNGDSKNRVTGRNFYMGKIRDFGENPVFKGVKSIYLKEISTINTVPPAEVFLSHEGNPVMTLAKFGKGFVFAVGDPWLYNEYIDNRKLPEEFENFKAAKNLFDYLLHDLKSK